MRAIWAVVLGLWVGSFPVSGPVSAQELSALARLVPSVSTITNRGKGIDVSLGLSQSVPWRVRLMNNPPRLVLDVREVDWRGMDSIPRQTDRIVDLRAGVFRPGWSRLVIELAGPYAVVTAEMQTREASARIHLRLDPTSAEDFSQKAALSDPPGWALPAPAPVPPEIRRGTGPLVVVLDPGHGGLDPGAERGGLSESHLMLTFARELKEEMLRQGGVLPVLTREEDVFVPLEARISIARAAGASLFISLHADALSEGEATGATIYTLSEGAVDRATKALAERHDRDDLLAGVDLTDQDDLVARVLMDMARNETGPKTDRLARAIVAAIQQSELPMHRRPLQSGGFSVLKSPDIPSILIELGFLSSPNDLALLNDPDWRRHMASAILSGVLEWSQGEAALLDAKKP